MPALLIVEDEVVLERVVLFPDNDPVRVEDLDRLPRRHAAARLLGISRDTLCYRMQKFGLE
jgi:transcriptional regulator of acetoin/glycerol metabolism